MLNQYRFDSRFKIRQSFTSVSQQQETSSLSSTSSGNEAPAERHIIFLHGSHVPLWCFHKHWLISTGIDSPIILSCLPLVFLPHYPPFSPFITFSSRHKSPPLPSASLLSITSSLPLCLSSSHILHLSLTTSSLCFLLFFFALIHSSFHSLLYFTFVSSCFLSSSFYPLNGSMAE